MKRLVLVAALLTIAFVAAPAHAMVDCYLYPNNAPFNGPIYNGCLEELYSTCYQCVNLDNGTGCASRRVCNPDGSGVMPPRYQLANAGSQRREPLQQPRTARRETSITAPARVAKLDTGKLF